MQGSSPGHAPADFPAPTPSSGPTFSLASVPARILRKEIENRGHILLRSIICSPEFAGGGYERYRWGKLNYEQRQRNENSDRLDLGEVVKCKIRDIFLDNSVLSLGRVWKFPRRAKE